MTITSTTSAGRRTRPATVLAALGLILALAGAACSSGGSAGPSDAGRDTTTSGTRQTTTSAPTTDTADDTTATTTAPPDAAAVTAAVTDRPYESHVPTGYDKARPTPLVVLLHGYGANGPGQAAYMGLIGAADRAGVLLAYPNGVTNRIGKKAWTATDACCGPRRNAPDDATYLAAVIADMQQRYDVDPKRIYVMGHSNGGFMSYRMACDHADTVAAIAVVEGAMWNDTSRCAPSAPVSVLAIHGTDDRTIKYDGGRTMTAPYPGAKKSVRYWVDADGCSPTPDSPAPASRDLVKDLAKATVTAYTKGCRGDSAVELWTQPKGSHIPAWTGTFGDQVLAWLLDHPKP